MRPITQSETWHILESFESHGVTVYERDFGRYFEAWKDGQLLVRDLSLSKVVEVAWGVLVAHATMIGEPAPMTHHAQREAKRLEVLREQQKVKEQQRFMIEQMRLREAFLAEDEKAQQEKSRTMRQRIQDYVRSKY